MTYFFLSLFFLYLFTILYLSRSLLMILLMIEFVGFLLVMVVSFSEYSSSTMSDYMIMVFFSILVMEGVVGLSGLISLVSFSGSDYPVSSTFLKI